MPKSLWQVQSLFHLGVLKLRICSQDHAQLRPSPKFKSSVLLDSFARQMSSTLDIQEFVENSCSLSHCINQTCWRQCDGDLHCNGEQDNFQTWISLPTILILEQEPNTGNYNFGTLCSIYMSHLADWNFPSVIHPLIGSTKKVRYQIVARISSATAQGHHFTIKVRTNNNNIFDADGMKMNIQHKVRSLSKFQGRGYAPRVNLNDNRNITAITGRKANTVAVFYVLDNEQAAQDLFFQHQKAALKSAHFGSINICNNTHEISFHREENGICIWTPCHESEITWTTKTKRISWEFKVSAVYLMKLTCRENRSIRR
jgi:hypothetical protein